MPSSNCLSFQSFAKCLSRNCLILITFHFHGGMWYLPFSEHYPCSKVQSFQRFLELSPFFSHSCVLFCSFSHSCKPQPICFQAIPHFCVRKHEGWGWRHRVDSHSLLTRSFGAVYSFGCCGP